MGRVLGGAPVSLAAPDRETVDRGVGLYLLELGSAPPPRTARRPPLRVSLCYLVTAGGDSQGDDRTHQGHHPLHLPVHTLGDEEAGTHESEGEQEEPIDEAR